MICIHHYFQVMATRGQQIMNALKQRDKEILIELSIPNYESTKSLNEKEREKAIYLAGML